MILYKNIIVLKNTTIGLNGKISFVDIIKLLTYIRKTNVFAFKNIVNKKGAKS